METRDSSTSDRQVLPLATTQLHFKLIFKRKDESKGLIVFPEPLEIVLSLTQLSLSSRPSLKENKPRKRRWKIHYIIH